MKNYSPKEAHMKSTAMIIGDIDLPLIEDKISMVPFDLKTLKGLSGKIKTLASEMLQNISHGGGTAYFTIHGRKLKKDDTLRRGGPHTDGSFDFSVFSWGGGWKVGEDGPDINSEEHIRLYNSENGGIILASNFEACLGWVGEFDGLPSVGGDCSHIKLNDPFMLKKNKIYYGNNHFIHESLPVTEDVHRVFARITLPENHIYN